ncbi:uncharacterized protein LOC142331995 [Lycorma delicatula]|uniref:uncharacterized protein LOC142331995 n=1 Tax=Lycorma delicatula TaxID=130591 RepID=UPI003F5101CC
MANRRITIYDYPEHLNPFFEDYAEERKSDNKYGTWGTLSRIKIRQSILDSNWIEALNLSPAKKKVTKKWSLFKTQTVEKFQRSRSKSNAFEHTIQRPERRDSSIYIRPQRLFSERLPSTSTPVKDEINTWTKSVNQQENNEKYTVQGAIPKIRKKRAAPRPPSSIPSPDSDTSVDMGSWNMSDSIDSGIQQSPVDEEVDVIEPELSICNQTNNSNEEKQETTHIRPLIEQPNIATLVSNNLTL